MTRSSYGDGLIFNLNRVEGSDNFIGYFGPADGFTITKGWDVTTIFTVDFGTSASDRTVKVDAWVNQGAEPAEEGAVARMDQVVITVPVTELEEYHTYKFNIADLAAEYVVSEGLESPTDAAFTGMTPVKLSIVVDETKDKAYEGKVRVAPVGAENLQLWAKDTANKWHDINVVGWGPGEGFPIDTTLVTNVYVVATAAFDGNVTLKLVDVDEAYGAEDNNIISQDVAFKAVADEEAAVQAAKAAFLDAATTYNPQSDIYTYSFDGESLDIDFDFTSIEYTDSGDLKGKVTNEVWAAAGAFLNSVFDENIGRAQEMTIEMNGKTINVVDTDAPFNSAIYGLADAVFNTPSLSLEVGKFIDKKNTPLVADFTMTVTNKDGITFTLDGLTATFDNVTEGEI